MKKTDNPKRPYHPHSIHKGEYGRILVVGGAKKYYGAPILTALGAEAAGADLITVCLPYEHFETAKHFSLNFFLKSFSEENLTSSDTTSILHYAESNHVLVMGNGLDKNFQTHTAVLTILEHIAIPVVLDADALFPEILALKQSKKNWILTPHRGEFKRLFGVSFSEKNLLKKSEEYACTILVKGPVDYIADAGKIFKNQTGCVQMKVGGTGDVLAGIVGSYRAQGLNNLESARAAAFYYGKAGEALAKQFHNFSAFQLSQFFTLK